MVFYFVLFSFAVVVGGDGFPFWDKVLLCSSWTHRDLPASLSQVPALKSYTTHHTWHELVILIWLMAHGSWSILGSMRYTVTSLFLFMSLKTVSPLEPDTKPMSTLPTYGPLSSRTHLSSCIYPGSRQTDEWETHSRYHGVENAFL